MPLPHYDEPLLDISEENLARRIEYEMQLRGWSQQKLADRMARAGYPIHQSAISKIVNPGDDETRRSISVDEAIGFAKVFDIAIERLCLPLYKVKGQEARTILSRLEALMDAQRRTDERIGILHRELDRAMRDGDAGS